MDAVIHLKEEYKNQLELLFTTHSSWDSVYNEPVFSVYNHDVIFFLNELSKKINKHTDIRRFPDVATFAFFCRKSNLLKFQGSSLGNNQLQIGRGVTFHIAPSNVPMNFAYSLVMGLLAGNVNIVKLPSKNFDQIKLFLDVLDAFRREMKFESVFSKIILVRYNRIGFITDFFSSFCSNRVIWGGDDTISNIRKSPIMPRAYDVTFCDRYSICVLEINAILNCSNLEQLALDFYNDTYLFDQNACTSPHVIIWYGDADKLIEAKTFFWNAIRKILESKSYIVESSTVIDKLVFAHEQAIDGKLNLFENKKNNLFIADLIQLESSISISHSNCGYFNEFYYDNLLLLSAIIDSPKYQTITYYGLNPIYLKNIIFDSGLKGVDRIVPVGKASDFSTIWDGYDIVSSLSRIINII